VAGGDPWDEAGRRYLAGHEGTARGRVRAHLLHRQLTAHLPPGPCRVVDVGGGAGPQAVLLARDGHEVTLVDSSPAMLARAAARLATEPAAVAARVRLVEATGQAAPGELGGERFGAVLCHGVLPYLDEPGPLLNALGELAGPGGWVSVLAKNAAAMAMRPGLAGDWAGALARFGTEREVNALGLPTRGDRVEDLAAALARRGVAPRAWYGVRLFTEAWPPDHPIPRAGDPVLEVEWEASRRDPYRRLSRLFHLLGQRPGPLANQPAAPRR